jgi:hypothetical protein
MKQTLGSQRLLQIAVEKKPHLLLQSLRKSKAVKRAADVEWLSPLAADGYREYRDGAALKKLGIESSLSQPLGKYWPARGPVWDGLGISSDGRPVLVEAKAHIPETVSGPSRASKKSLRRIEAALAEARRHLAPRNKTDWNGLFYQYANRLAFQNFLRKMNGVDSSLVFLYFTNADDVDGPTSEAEWKGAIRLTHATLGLGADLSEFGVHKAFMDARLLTDVG